MKHTRQETGTLLGAACFAVLALILLIGSTLVYGQEYPSKTITMIVPAGPGGSLDVLGRFLAQEMGNLLKQRIIVENVAGAGSTIGTARVAKAAGDGYTILFQNVGIAIAPALYRKLTFDPINDLEPIGRVADMPMTLVARKDFPAKDLKEMLAYVKANKDKINFAHAGTGSSTHLCSMLFMSDIKTDMTMVPYKGGGPALKDLMGGQVDLFCDSTLSTLGHIKSGTIKVYAVTSATRVSSLPDVPTVKETGLVDFEMTVWMGLWASKGTPKPIIGKLSAALQDALKSPLMKQRLLEFGTEPAPQLANPEALRVLLQNEIKKWEPLIKKAGVHAD
jgi:tripartite-type tricarboxylate transporter receptor subunit TctC